jgi:hypothetical protein
MNRFNRITSQIRVKTSSPFLFTAGIEGLMAILVDNDDQFRWPVAAAGYEWILARDEKAPRPVGGEISLTPMLVQSQRVRVVQSTLPTWYAPMLDEPALFRIFADTLATRDGIHAFADKYGMLGGPYSIPINHAETVQPAVFAERLGAWLHAIFEMRAVIAVWSMVTALDTAGLAEVISWRETRMTFVPKEAWRFPDWSTTPEGLMLPENPPWFEGQYDGSVDSTLFGWEKRKAPGRIRDADYLEAAMMVIRSIVNDNLCGGEWAGAPSRLVIDRKTSRPVLRQIPAYLAGALWLQCAEAITQGTQFRVCKQCSKWFAIPKRGARIDREYCSDACRSRAYRGRQEQAHDLHSQGRSVKEISVELGVDSNVVRKWLKKRKG